MAARVTESSDLTYAKRGALMGGFVRLGRKRCCAGSRIATSRTRRRSGSAGRERLQKLHWLALTRTGTSEEKA
jgi:hypothetical protein